jgi:hypothetical protein
MNFKSVVTAMCIIVAIVNSGNALAQEAKRNIPVVLKGKIVKEPFVHNKSVKGVYDYFLQTADKKYFIKTYKTKYSKTDIDKWAGEQVEVNAVIVKEGSWDDNGEGQSRVGEYVDLIDIKKG